MRWLRRADVSLFLSYFLFGSAVLAGVVFYLRDNEEEAYRQFRDSKMQEEAYRFIGRMADRGIPGGPLTEADAAWLARESAIYHLRIRYGDAGSVWFDELGEAGAGDALTLRAPLVVRGEVRGTVTAIPRLTGTEGIPEAASAQTRAAGERTVWLAGFAAIALAATALARRQSAALARTARWAQEIRKGDDSADPPPGGAAELRTIRLTIRELAAKLEKQEGIRGQLMQDLTHEFRTPITSMMTEIDAMLDGIYPIGEERLQEIYGELERLTRLINDVEQLFDAEGAKFKLTIERCDLVPVVQAVCKNFMPVARSKGLKLGFDHPYKPCHAEIDQDRIAQIVINLLTNAMKFTPEQGEITVGVYAASEEEAAIYCRDNGIGIGPDDVPRIFDRFYRANRFGSRRIGGLGVGLSICKALAEAHDGKISVESAAGSGSLFTVALPVAYKQKKNGSGET